MKLIPLSGPDITDAEIEAVTSVLRSERLSLGPKLREFEQAIAKDSSFAPAYAGLGAAYATRSIMFPLAHPPDELVKMRSAAIPPE